MSNIKPSNNPILSVIEFVLFGSRWLLLIPFIGLSVGLAIYCWKFAIELWEMILHVQTLTTEMTMLGILGLVDIAMVANLVIMVNIGGYFIFLRELKVDQIPNRPRFMNHITAGGLKTKMATSLVGVSSIHLLKKFIEAASEDKMHEITWKSISIMLVIHAIFIVSGVALAFIDRIGHSPDFRTEEKHA